MDTSRRTLISNALTMVAVVVLVLIYFTPIWWVSLTAPNYPAEAFPDGVRIHFHTNGVFNGCEKVAKTEISEDEALDCVHEMDTINHYVGMYPIAAGGVLERAFSQFLVAMLGIMLIGFLFLNPKLRSVVMGIGFLLLAAWMTVTWHLDDGLKFQNTGYLEGLVTALDQDTSDDAVIDSSSAIIQRLKESLKASGVEVEDPATANEIDEKSRHIQHLKLTFEKDQERRPAAQRLQWNGSGAQMMSWHYEKSLARYFNVPEQIGPMVATMSTFGDAVFWAMIAAMLLLLVITYRNSSPTYWLLILPAILLPLFFLIDYSAWLWWYGHTLNDMGAFTVKPFMPTVFGDGKVAQFTTHSYPYTGFGLMLLNSLILVIAANQRYRHLRETG